MLNPQICAENGVRKKTQQCLFSNLLRLPSETPGASRSYLWWKRQNINEIPGRRLVSSRSAWRRCAAALASPSASWMTPCSSTPSRLVSSSGLPVLVLVLGLGLSLGHGHGQLCDSRGFLDIHFEIPRDYKRTRDHILEMNLRNLSYEVWPRAKFMSDGHVLSATHSFYADGIPLMAQYLVNVYFDKGACPPRITCHACGQCRPCELWPLLA